MSSTVDITISSNRTSRGCRGRGPGFGEITASIITRGHAARVRRRGGEWTNSAAGAASVLGGAGRGWRPPGGRGGGRGRRRIVQS
eukprot:04077.XXX_180197_180451_1 [CDS] Oithona nana genome sequencing.